MLPTSSLTAVFFFSFFIAVAAVISPGPISVTIVSQAPNRGWIVGPLVATGHSVLELFIVLLLAFGLQKALVVPPIHIAISLFGGLVLLWMGALLIRDIWRGKIQLPERDKGKTPLLSNWQLVSLGAVATISNPFWYAWWVTVAAGYLAQAFSLGIAVVGAFFIGHILADYIWDSVLSGIVGGGKQWFTPRMYRGMMVLCGLFFLYLGIAFIQQGFHLMH